jgi:hypothetical protein
MSKRPKKAGNATYGDIATMFTKGVVDHIKKEKVIENNRNPNEKKRKAGEA